MSKPVDNELDTIIIQLTTHIKRAMGGRQVGGGELSPEEAKARLLQWGTEQRIDELSNHVAEWLVINNQTFYAIKERISELQASLKDGGKK